VAREGVLATAVLTFAGGFLTCGAIGLLVTWRALSEDRAKVPLPKPSVRPTTIERA
jgi:hypothetical protein